MRQLTIFQPARSLRSLAIIMLSLRHRCCCSNIVASAPHASLRYASLASSVGYASLRYSTTVRGLLLPPRPLPRKLGRARSGRCNPRTSVQVPLPQLLLLLQQQMVCLRQELLLKHSSVVITSISFVYTPLCVFFLIHSYV